MPKFLLFAVELNPSTYFKASLLVDLLVVLTTLVAYFSNELIISTFDTIVSVVFTALFVTLMVMSLIRYMKGRLTRRLFAHDIPQFLLRGQGGVSFVLADHEHCDLLPAGSCAFYRKGLCFYFCSVVPVVSDQCDEHEGTL